MRAAGIPLADAVQVKEKEDEDKFNTMVEREIKRKRKSDTSCLNRENNKPNVEVCKPQDLSKINNSRTPKILYAEKGPKDV
jgi:hypothetical protein